LTNAKKEANALLDNSRKESSEIMKKAEKLEERVIEKEEKLESKLDEITKKQESLSIKEDDLKAKESEIDNVRQELDNKLSELSKLSIEEARELFLNQIATKYQNDAMAQIEKYKKSIDERKNEVAREIILKSIQQYAGDVTSEVTTTIIPLPNDDLK
jgi:ribonucrease Y